MGNSSRARDHRVSKLFFVRSLSHFECVMAFSASTLRSLACCKSISAFSGIFSGDSVGACGEKETFLGSFPTILFLRMLCLGPGAELFSAQAFCLSLSLETVTPEMKAVGFLV